MCSRSEDPALRATPAIIDEYRRFVQAFPREYTWLQTSVEDFEAKLNQAHGLSTDDVNVTYWTDVARSLEAYGMLAGWRLEAVLRAFLSAVDRDEVIGPALLSRAAIELAASFVANVTPVADEVRRAVEAPPGHVVGSDEEFDALIIRMVFGTRLPGRPEHLTQRNVLGQLKRLDKWLPDFRPQQTYDYLSEVAHPNVAGYAQFWHGHLKLDQGEGQILHMKSNAARGPFTVDILTNSLRAAACACAAFMRVYDKGVCASVAMLSERWPVQESDGHNGGG